MENKTKFIIPDDYYYDEGASDQFPIFDCEEDARKFEELQIIYEDGVCYNPVISFECHTNKKISDVVEIDTIPEGHQPPILEQEFHIAKEFDNVAYFKSFKITDDGKDRQFYTSADCHISSINNIENLKVGSINSVEHPAGGIGFNKTIKLDNDDVLSYSDYASFNVLTHPVLGKIIDIVVFRMFDRYHFETSHSGWTKVQVADECKKVTNTFETKYKKTISTYAGKFSKDLDKIQDAINSVLK
jgi:hypothetical protein